MLGEAYNRKSRQLTSRLDIMPGLPSDKESRGYVYKHANTLCKPIKTEGEMTYLKLWSAVMVQ